MGYKELLKNLNFQDLSKIKIEEAYKQQPKAIKNVILTRIATILSILKIRHLF